MKIIENGRTYQSVANWRAYRGKSKDQGGYPIEIPVPGPIKMVKDIISSENDNIFNFQTLILFIMMVSIFVGLPLYIIYLLVGW